MQALAARFVPVADEVGRLQRGKDAECRLFQEFAEQGHYAGRTQPSNTRQGIYAVTPGGRFLASVNTTRANAMVRMLEQALARWQELLPEERGLSAERARDIAAIRRWEDSYPEDGLVLRVHSRDLPDAKPTRRWHRDASNRDYAWFREGEARQLFAAEVKVGAEHQVPRPLVERIVRFHLVDNVRGQTSAVRKEHLRRAELASEVTAVDGARVTIELRGRSRSDHKGRWPVRNFRDRDRPPEVEIGVETALLGRAVYDLDAQRFTTFEMVALGTRWGGTQFNSRGEDLEPSPIGFSLTLADGSERVAPAFIWSYGWR